MYNKESELAKFAYLLDKIDAVTLKEIKSYKKDSLSNCESKLNKFVYAFEDNKLVSID